VSLRSLLASLSFRARITVQWTAVFGLLLAAAGLTIYAGVSSYLRLDLDRKVRTLARTEAASATDGVAGVHLHEPPIGELSADDIAPKFAQIFDADGRLVLESHELGRGVGLVPAEAIAAAFDGGVPLVTVNADARPARVAVVRAASTSQQYAVAVGLFTEENDRFLASLARLLAGVWLVGVLATGALGYVLSSRALLPIAGITSRAARIARGDFSVRLDPPALDDEVGRMTRSLNDVLERLYASLAANRRFAADASHELRGPVTAMLGEIDVTLKRPRDAAAYRQTLELVRERLQMMVAIIEDLTMLVRAQEGGRELVLQVVPLRPTLDEVLGRVRPLAVTRRVQIEVDDLGPFVAYAEPRLLARVLENVLTNAVQYNRDAGRVSVRARYEEQAGDRPSLIVLSVADTGPGIPESERDRIFERFYRVDQSRARHTGGTGLGLAICREVLTAMHGSVRVAASSSAGTTLDVSIPGAIAKSAI
jgi:signal transduction histidine kinase